MILFSVVFSGNLKLLDNYRLIKRFFLKKNFFKSILFSDFEPIIENNILNLFLWCVFFNRIGIAKVILLKLKVLLRNIYFSNYGLKNKYLNLKSFLVYFN